jgi:hypothetical protein
MTASRRLQLAAEGSSTIGIAIRRWRRPAEAAESRRAAHCQWNFYAHRKWRELLSGSRGDNVLCNRAKLFRLSLYRRHLRL